MKTLMLNLIGRPTPFAYQVPEPVYEEFKHLESSFEVSPLVLDEIGISCNTHVNRLMSSIQKWKTNCLKEIKSHEEMENAKILAKGIFDI